MSLRLAGVWIGGAILRSTLIYNFRDYFRLAEKELGKTFRAEN